MEVQPVEMAAYPTEDNPVESEQVCFLGALTHLEFGSVVAF